MPPSFLHAKNVSLKNMGRVRSYYLIRIFGLCLLLSLVCVELVAFVPGVDAHSHTAATVNNECGQVGFSPDGNPFPICPGPFPTGGNCVWWAWEQWHLLGYDLPLNWGNAADWITDAERSGLPLGTTPRVGSIAVFPRADGVWAYGTPGHVAFVTSVSDDSSTFNVTYQNYGDTTPMYTGTNYNVSVINQTRFQNGQLRFIYFPKAMKSQSFLRLPGVGTSNPSVVLGANKVLATSASTLTNNRITLGAQSVSSDQEFNADFTGTGYSDLLLYNRQQGRLNVLKLSHLPQQKTYVSRATSRSGNDAPLSQVISLADSTTPADKWGSSLDVHIGDFDGLGRSELLLYDRVAGTIQILSLTPQLTIQKHVVLSGWGTNWEAYVGRFDGQRSGVFMYKRYAQPDANAVATPTDTTGGVDTVPTNTTGGVDIVPTDSPTVSTQPSPTATTSAGHTAKSEPTPKLNPTATPKLNPTVTPKPSPTTILSPTPTPGVTVSPSPTTALSPTPTPGVTVSPSPTTVPSSAGTSTPTTTITSSPTVTPVPTATAGSTTTGATVTSSPTVGATETPTPTRTITTTPAPTVTPTPTVTPKGKGKKSATPMSHVYAGFADTSPSPTPTTGTGDLSGTAPQDWEKLGRTANIVVLDFDKDFKVHVQQSYTLWHANWEVYVGRFISPTQDGIFLYDRLAGEGRIMDFDAKLLINHYQETHNLDGNWVLYSGDFTGAGRAQLFLYDPVNGAGQMLAFKSDLTLANQLTYSNLGTSMVLYAGHFGLPTVSVMLYDPQAGQSTFLAFDKSLAISQQTTVQSWGQRWQILVGAFLDRSRCIVNGNCATGDDILVLDRQTGQIGQYVFSFGRKFQVYDNRSQAFLRQDGVPDTRLNKVDTTTFSLLNTLSTNIHDEELY